jgi:DNA polymerase-3 subunit gamma/tau
VSPQFRGELPDLARAIGKTRLLQWQAQLKGSEQQLRHSVNPRLWLEVLLLGLLAEPVAVATAAPVPTRAVAPAPVPTPTSTPSPAPAAPPLAATPAPAAQAEPPPAIPAPAAATPATEAATTTAAAEHSPNLPELWQQILAGLELPSTRMLLSQQAQLVRLDERRAVVQVAGNWMAMVQSRLSLLETAVTKALGSPRQLVLEGGGEPMPPPSAAPAPAAPAAMEPPSAAAAPRPTPAPAPTGAQAETASPTPVASAAPHPAAPLDEKARRLAEFFNGEVVDLDGPLDGLPSSEAAA